MSRHFDVVVLGRSLGALTAAALLARRDLRVLLLGQGQRPAAYHVEGRRLLRRTFTLLAGSSPVWRRVLHELAQTQRFRRHVTPHDPMFAVLHRRQRLEIPPDPEVFAREVDREFPEVRQVVDELYANLAQSNAAIDAAFERDAVWPPATAWERFETGRAVAGLPFVGAEAARDLLGKFPPGHAYRDVVTLPAAFSSDLASQGHDLPTLGLARLHGAWTRGVLAVPRGEEELEEFLLARFAAHGGEYRLDDRATSLTVRRGVVGVVTDGADEPVGTSTVVTDLSGELLADLAGGEGITPAARREWPRVTATQGRFVVALRVRTRGLPEALPPETFLVPDRGGKVNPRRPNLRLQRLAVTDEPEGEAETLLVAEALLPVRGALSTLECRQAVMSTLEEQLPFIARHLVLVDSPHDGLPAEDFSRGTRRTLDRVHLKDASAHPEPMAWQWSVEPHPWLGLGGEPLRGPIPGTFLVGPTVLPGLGQEGQLLAALGAARLVTRRDGARQRRRSHMWSKIET